MKKIFLILSLFLSSTAFASQTIKFATEASYPPFEYTNQKGEIIGFDIDIAKALCSQIKAKCTFTNQSFDSLIPAIKFNRYDAAISAMDITAERSKQVSFSDPYYDNAAEFIAINPKDKSINDLKGKRVGVQNGTTHQKYINENLKDIITVPYDSYQNALIDLKNGRVEAVFGDTAVLNEWLKKDNKLHIVGDKVTDKNYFGNGLGIAVNKSNTKLLNQLNKALATIKSNGKYQKIYDKYFKQ